jgi:hypothetical protein
MADLGRFGSNGFAVSRTQPQIAMFYLIFTAGSPCPTDSPAHYLTTEFFLGNLLKFIAV